MVTFQQQTKSRLRQYNQRQALRTGASFVVDQASKIRPQAFWRPSFDFSRTQDMNPKIEDRVSVELNDKVRFRL